ncbi:hypothetical protein K469DRAFT_744142 [Zopfia rhizophila CBS 207.26]|uniref:Uncharacterized protein n=1 Tax=Zopfia rhizophila CBS 207.26 TaxID=1314779 RepID=A0A6A6EZS7_9PEZI|nr:hypothetical protein K469DRAFT_744142 [Zopfia rhizophila CBS 207.26]
MVDSRCSNIYGVKPSWGNTIFVSPPGGKFNSTPGNGTDGGVGGPGGSGDGSARDVVAPPACAKLTDNATTNTPSDPFINVNPALGSAEFCNSRLQAGLTYCLHPMQGWNNTLPTDPTRGPPSVTTSIPSTTARPSSSATPKPSHPVSRNGQYGSTPP